MRIFQVGSLSFFLWLVCSLPALSQDSASPAPPSGVTAAAPAPSGAAEQPSPPAASFNDVIDRVVEREHLFLAQMRHLRPMVETYLQDLKTDKDGNAYPSKISIFSDAST